MWPVPGFNFSEPTRPGKSKRLDEKPTESPLVIGFNLLGGAFNLFVSVNMAVCHTFVLLEARVTGEQSSLTRNE